jgi:hypothetical protein
MSNNHFISGRKMSAPNLKWVINAINALRQDASIRLLHFGSPIAATDTARHTNSALQKLFRVSELKLIIFHQLPVDDLLVATQVCKE